MESKRVKEIKKILIKLNVIGRCKCNKLFIKKSPNNVDCNICLTKNKNKKYQKKKKIIPKHSSGLSTSKFYTMIKMKRDQKIRDLTEEEYANKGLKCSDCVGDSVKKKEVLNAKPMYAYKETKGAEKLVTFICHHHAIKRGLINKDFR